MPSLLLLPSTDALFFHTPALVNLLRSAGFNVTIADCESALPVSFIRNLTGNPPGGKGHFNEGLFNEGHFGVGHCDDGHCDEGHCDEGHCDKGHFDVGRFDDAHCGDAHCNDAHCDIGHFDNGNFDNSNFDDSHCDNGNLDVGHFDDNHCDKGHFNNGHCDIGHCNDAHCNDAHFDVVLAAPARHPLSPRLISCLKHLAGNPTTLIAPIIDSQFSPDNMPHCVLILPPTEVTPITVGHTNFRVASPEQCAEYAIAAVTPQDFTGQTILLTAGPTIEDADPARFISNRSTGRMGTAIARMAARRGANVILIHGPMSASIPPLKVILDVPVRSATDMMSAVKCHLQDADIAILCAAVADFAPVEFSEEKIKKGTSRLFTLQMKRTPDILAYVGALPEHPFLVGFAAESSNINTNAREKLNAKHCDLLCANDITAPGCGFEVPTNSLSVFGHDDFHTTIPLASKEIVANRLLDLILTRKNTPPQ